MSVEDKNNHFCMDDRFFGAVTVGERGQVVIPAEARKKLNIQPGDKLLVMGHPFADGLILATMDSLQEFITGFMKGLSVAVESAGNGSNGNGNPL